jgi:hypothetical protein
MDTTSTKEENVFAERFEVLNIVFLYLFRQHPLVVNFKYFTIPPLSFIFVFFCIQPTPLHENLLVPGYSVVVLKSLGIRVLCGCITVGLKSFCKHVFFFSWSRIHGNYDYMSPSTMRLHLNILAKSVNWTANIYPISHVISCINYFLFILMSFSCT